MPEWLAARKVVEARVTSTRRELSRQRQTTMLDEFIGNSAQLRATWSELTLSRQQAIVKALLDHAVIRPELRRSSRFDPARVVPVWRL